MPVNVSNDDSLSNKNGIFDLHWKMINLTIFITITNLIPDQRIDFDWFEFSIESGHPLDAGYGGVAAAGMGSQGGAILYTERTGTNTADFPETHYMDGPGVQVENASS